MAEGARRRPRPARAADPLSNGVSELCGWPLRVCHTLPFPVHRPLQKFLRAHRPDGSIVLGWPGRAVFWIRPRLHRVDYVPIRGATRAAVDDVLLGPVASYLLILDGCDPLHASALRIDGHAVGFLGQPGAGKSTVAAALLLQGYPLLTDDLLALRWRGQRPYVMPSRPEIRLWPASGRRLLPDFERLPRVVPTALKRRLDPRRHGGGFARTPARLRLLYELRRGATTRPRIEPLNRREAFLALVRNLYNTAMTDPATLRRQFHGFSRLAAAVPVRQIRLPRRAPDPNRIAAVLLADVRRALRHRHAVRCR